MHLAGYIRLISRVFRLSLRKKTIMKRSRVKPFDADYSATSTELLRQAQADDQTAWEQLVELYSRRMYRWCRRAGLQPADASNTVQEALQAVARKLGDFHRNRPGDTFRGWLRRITDNKIRDHFRKKGKTPDLATGGPDSQQMLTYLANDKEHAPISNDTSLAAKPSLQSTQLLDVIEQVRADASERDWKFFWRVAVDGQSAADVGREFGVTANTVRLVKMRMLRRLRKHMNHPS